MWRERWAFVANRLSLAVLGCWVVLAWSDVLEGTQIRGYSRVETGSRVGEG
jgi:hypothetical protein